MAKINLGGGKQITVSKELARRVANFKADPDILPNEIFQCDDFMAEKRDIKSVIVNDYEDNAQEKSADKKDSNDEYYKQIQKDHDEEIRRRCAMRPDEKAKDTRLAELACFQPITQEFREKIIAKQREYFAKHPKHPYAAINFSELLQEEKGKDYSIQSMLPAFTLKKVEEIMGEGMRTANYLKLI